MYCFFCMFKAKHKEHYTTTQWSNSLKLFALVPVLLSSLGGRLGNVWIQVLMEAESRFMIHIRVLLSCQQPTSQQFTNVNNCSAAWSAFHLKRVIVRFVSSEISRCRSLKWLFGPILCTTSCRSMRPAGGRQESDDGEGGGKRQRTAEDRMARNNIWREEGARRKLLQAELLSFVCFT